MEEFSTSRHGQRLVDAAARDKFLRPVPGDESTAITRALEIAADLYYLNHHVIGPALSKGAVVLKDRHRDTHIYTVAPMLLAAGAMPDEGIAVAWLTSLNVTDEDIRIFGHRDKIAKRSSQHTRTAISPSTTSTSM